MKHAKKLLCLLLALVMVLSMSVTAFAAGNGMITVKNTVNGADYTIYRIFDLESYAGSNENDAHSYKVADKWKAYFAENAAGRTYFNVDGNGYVTVKENADLVAFTKAALKYAQDSSIAKDGTAKGTGSDIKFTNLELGYYLVDSSVGALCALTTADPDGVVIEKNANPTLEKEVKEGDTWGDTSDANIGDTVEFKATITVQGLAKGYVMHDVMDDGLEYEKVSSVTLNDKTVDSSNYTVVTEGLTDGCTFEVRFTDAFCSMLKSGNEIVVYYQATLTDKAVVKEAETNKANLEYKDNNDETHKTEDDDTKTYTWELPVLKYANGDKENTLAGAKFSLYTDESCTTLVKFHEVKAEGQTTVYRVDNLGTDTEITTDSTGKFKMEGLDAGTYYLKETEAPAGYNKLNTVVKVVIDHNGKINATESVPNGATQIEVENKAGTELPSTGGMGTTIFYVIGSILLIGAAVLLVTRKRMSAEK